MKQNTKDCSLQFSLFVRIYSYVVWILATSTCRFPLGSLSNHDGIAKDNFNKNEFIFNLRISEESGFIQFVYHCQSYPKTEYVRQR
jgi:hypothetical protein